jgi:NADPH:quinone reductase-like Zn-dependent oxidoreductase
MKAVRFHEYGDPSVLRLEDVDRPEPGPGEVRIKVAATSFNPLDARIRAGALREVMPIELPHIPGIDVAGTVDALGARVTHLAEEDAVVGLLSLGAGPAAEYVIAPADVLAAAPTAIPLADAAALPAVGLTAWQAIFELADVAQGQRVLINGAGGAVGGYAVQLGKRAGATVVASASPRSADRARTAGADAIIDYTETSVTEAVGAPVDVVLNLAPAAPEQMVALAGVVADGGIVLSTTTPPAGDADRGVRATHVFVRSDAEQLAGLVDTVDAGDLHVDVADHRPLAELPAVHEQSAAGELNGKVVLVASS